MEPLEALLDEEGPPRWQLPGELERLYGGPLGFEEPRLLTNFVETLDGVVAIPEVERSPALVSDRSEADRFVMGLLRACADVVLLGSGTLLSSPTGAWRADSVWPDGKEAFAELRRRRGRPEHPALAVVTSGGSFDPSHRVLAERGALVLTTEAAAPALAASVPAASEVVAVSGGDLVDVAAALAVLRERGHAVVLSEAGPTLHASLLARGLVDELFLTLSPLVAGRARAPRLALVEGVELLPEHRVAGTLASVRAARDHLFLRYRFRA